jgi:hypothetical protein
MAMDLYFRMGVFLKRKHVVLKKTDCKTSNKKETTRNKEGFLARAKNRFFNS